MWGWTCKRINLKKSLRHRDPIKNRESISPKLHIWINFGKPKNLPIQYYHKGKHKEPLLLHQI